MSEDQNQTIAPQAAPLSHLNKNRTQRRRQDPRIYIVVAVVLLIGVGAILLVPSQTVDPGAKVTTASVDGTASGNGDAAQPNNAEETPFAATQRRLARERSQKSLAEFVERQIELEENMQVAAWGQTLLDEALAQATAGDAAFANERYEEAMAAYEQANVAIAAVIDKGNELFQTNLDEGLAAIEIKNPQLAAEKLAAAELIKPKSTSVQAAIARNDKLPRVISLIRTARNHELAERYPDALTTYREVLTLDPQTKGIEAMMSEAENRQTQMDVARHLSNGFAALEGKRFDAARAAFNRALNLDPGNDIARGGLQQVAENNDLSVIARHRQTADAAMRDENWSTALTEYEAVLALDGNIQFAVTGRRQAQEHDRAHKLLDAISREPQRLSSQSLYLQAEEILASATQLEFRGPTLNGLIEETTTLLKLYKEPVEVVLTSDNATDIVVSNLGRLGFFTTKTITVRPGEYTIRGSQAGCRDLYLTVEILPGIEPLDLSCPERL